MLAARGRFVTPRVSRVYFGARDREMGACGGVMNLFMEDFPHPPALVGACWRPNAPRSCGNFSGACARSKISLIFPLTKPGKWLYYVISSANAVMGTSSAPSRCQESRRLVQGGHGGSREYHPGASG